MPYRLPLELEFTILDFAAPPLAIDSLHARVDYFIKTSLVHRSLTAWARERLHDQFLYTYRQRSSEHERLKSRFEQGIGRDRPLRRLYLDMSGLPTDIGGPNGPGTNSVSATIDGRVYRAVSSKSGPENAGEGGTRAEEQACEAVAHHSEFARGAGCWRLCRIIKTYSQRLGMLWLKLPLIKLDIADLPAPRAFCVDDGACSFRWGSFDTLPLSSDTVLFLRNVGLDRDRDTGYLDPRHLIFDKCYLDEAPAKELLGRCRHLETLILFEMFVDDFVPVLANLPTTLKRVHFLQQQQDMYFDENFSDASVVLPHLETFTLTLLPPSADRGPQQLADDDQAALSRLQQAVESIINAPNCTFKYLRSTESPESALADALAAFNL